MTILMKQQYLGDWREGLSAAQCRPLIQHYGQQSSAYFNLQSDVRRFGDPRLGFLAYAPVSTLFGRVNIVFANPVCISSLQPLLLRQCLEQVPGQFLFSGIDDSVTGDLQALGFTINAMGTEFRVRIPEFDTVGRDKKQLRHAGNLGRRCQLRVLEQQAREVDTEQMARISRRWRQHKRVRNHELRLLTRPPVFSDEWGVRRFYAYDRSDRLLGYVFFDPFFENGEVVGYTANILRQDMEQSPSGLLDFIILEAMERFHREGIEYLSLGISPLHNIEAIPGDNPLIRRVAQLLYRHGNRLYAFRSLAYHKTRYRGEETRWYLASRETSTLKAAWSLLRGTGILGSPGYVQPSRDPSVPVPG